MLLTSAVVLLTSAVVVEVSSSTDVPSGVGRARRHVSKLEYQPSKEDLYTKLSSLSNVMSTEDNKEAVDDVVEGFSRREVLRKSAMTAAVGTGAAAMSGTAFAGEKKCGSSENLDEAPSSYPWYDIEHWEDHGFPWGEDEIAMYINGWQANYDRATNQGYECRRAMYDNGYWSEVAGIHWDSETGTWSGGEDKADEMGENLAYFIDYLKDNGTNTVRLIGHSLGARVIGTCLNRLRDDYGRSVTSAALLGGAIEEDSVVEDCGLWCVGEFYYGIRDAGGNFRNYHSTEDAVLDDLYTLAEWDAAVGQYGADGPEAANYNDHDVTNKVGSEHCAYYRRGDGCMDEVVAHY